MEILQPDSWGEALELKAAHPEAVPIAGGTDLMVELNFDRRRSSTWSGSPSWASGGRTTGGCASARASPTRG